MKKESNTISNVNLDNLIKQFYDNNDPSKDSSMFDEIIYYLHDKLDMKQLLTTTEIDFLLRRCVLDFTVDDQLVSTLTIKLYKDVFIITFIKYFDKFYIHSIFNKCINALH